MRTLIHHFDALLRRAYGVFTFCDDEQCVLRIRLIEASHALKLADQTVRPGDTVLELHLWNEHIPPLPPDGPDMAWALQMRRLLIHSFHALAQEVHQNPSLAGVRAIVGVSVMLSPQGHPASAQLLQRLGFTILPYHRPLGRFGEFWENFYSWWIMWTFNVASLRHRRFFHLYRAELWMLADEFSRRYS